MLNSTRCLGILLAFAAAGFFACGGGGDGRRTVIASAVAQPSGSSASQQPGGTSQGYTGGSLQGSSSGPQTGIPTISVLYALVTPDGKSGTELLSMFGISSSGSLNGLSGSPLTTGGEGNRNSKSSSVVVTFDRRRVLASHNTSKQVECFTTQTNGNLVSTGLATLSDDPSDLAVHPNGNVAYASLGNSGKVAVIQIDSTTGALSTAPGSPVAVGSSVRDLDVDPSGRFLATGHMFGADRGVVVHRLSAVGDIVTPPAQKVPLPGRAGASVCFGRNGELLLVRDLDRGVYVYRVNTQSGQLSQVSGSPYSVGGFSSDMAVHPTGNFVYVLRPFSTSEIRGFRIESYGTLTPLSGFPVKLDSGSGQDNYQAIVCGTSGLSLYAAARGSSQVKGYAVNPMVGVLAPVGQAVAVPGASATGGTKLVPGALLVLD
ncbi:lactonase family protein [Planctomycetota bacterium]